MKNRTHATLLCSLAAYSTGTYTEPSAYDKFMDKFNAAPDKTKELGKSVAEPIG
jgi:hypothetical protein